MFFRPISISFAPNFQLDDNVLAIQLMLGLRHKNTLIKEKHTFKKIFSKQFGVKKTFLFSSGRAALYYALGSLGLKKGDEVLIQAFTCLAVPSAVVWAGLKPIYIDIYKTTFNIDVSDAEKK